jgi:hypothetical protein
MMRTTTAIAGNDDYLTAVADTWDACGFARHRLLFDPDVHQQAVLECNARRVILDGSRNVGISDVHATSRGLSGASMLIFDQVAQVSGELYKAMRATRATSRGALWLLSTPYGKRGFFYDEWATGRNWTRFEVQVTDCPRIPPDYLESERRDLGPDYFQQEYMGHSFAPMDAAFNEATGRRALDLNGPGPLLVPISYDLAPENTHHMLRRESFMGLDLGQRRDHAALVVLETADITSKDRSAVTFASTFTTQNRAPHRASPSRHSVPRPRRTSHAHRGYSRRSGAWPQSCSAGATAKTSPTAFGDYRRCTSSAASELAFDFNHFTIQPSLERAETLIEELASMRGIQRNKAASSKRSRDSADAGMVGRRNACTRHARSRQAAHVIQSQSKRHNYDRPEKMR